MNINYEIVFDNNAYGVFYGGQTMSGAVKLVLEKPKKIRGIVFEITGYAKCWWEEKSTTRNNKKATTIYTGREDYLQSMSYLAGSEKGSALDLSTGFHTFNFSFILPKNLPTSIEASNGFIRYTAKVVLKRPWKFDLSYAIGFTVIKPLDLNNEIPNLNNPYKTEVTKKFWFSFGTSNKVRMAVSIPMSGFVAGQNMNIKAEINNESNVEIACFKVLLRRIIHYHATSPKKTKIEERIENELSCAGVPKNENKTYDVHLKISAMSPTNVNSCSIIQIFYELQVKAKILGFHESPVLKIPITIGTVPLITSQQSGQMHADLPSSDSTSSSNRIRRQNNLELPPPTYEECLKRDPIKFDEQQKHTVTQNDYRPRYPVYRLDNRNQNDLNRLGN